MGTNAEGPPNGKPPTAKGLKPTFATSANAQDTKPANFHNGHQHRRAPAMLNTPEAYREAGHKTATARRQHDEARAQFHRQWFTRAQALEQPEDRAEARRLFDEGYSEAQPHRPAAYF
jgi:hypothetical protein